MPSAPQRPCNVQHCRRMAFYPNARCRAHQRPSAQQRGYTHEWAVYSRAWLVRFPYCGMRQDGLFHVEHSRCAARGEHVQATCTDHILAMRAGGSQFDPANHQSLCRGCNIRKGIALEGTFGR